MDEINNISSIDNINNIDNINDIEEIIQSNETNEFKNTLPITLNKFNKINKISKIGRIAGFIKKDRIVSDNKYKNIYNNNSDTNNIKAVNIKKDKPNKLRIINIGQLLFTLFLMTVIFTQTINLLSGSLISITDSTRTGNSGSDSNLPLNNAQNKADNAVNINNDANNLNIDGEDINNIAVNPDNSGVIFILGEIEGKLAILSPDGATVYEIFDVYINTLPEYDRNLLIGGIKITSSEELHSLLEDYSS